MKTLNHAPGQSATLRLLDWSDSAALSREGLNRTSPAQSRIPALRLVRQLPANEDLFEHAFRAKQRSAFWEGVVFGSLAASGLAAILWSFFGS